MPKACKTAEKTAKKTTKKTTKKTMEKVEKKTEEKTTGKGNKTSRTRNYATVVYPDSAPEGWQDILTEMKIPALISPLHDSDVNPDGEKKKAHYHVMIMYDNVKTVEQAEDVFKKIGGVGCEIVQSIRGYARYLCHLDNPEKHQYSQDDVTAICGVDYFGCIGLPTDKYKAIREMIEFCNLHDILSFHVLLLYAQEERNDWFRILCDSGTYIMKEYLKSRGWAKKSEIQADNDASLR